MSSVQESVEPGRKRQNNGVVLSDEKAPEVPMTFLDRKFISLSEAKSQLLHLLETHYLADHKESLAVATEEMAIVDCSLFILWMKQSRT